MNNKTKPVSKRNKKAGIKKQNRDYLTVDKICLSLCLLAAAMCIFIAALVSLKYVYQNSEWNQLIQSNKNNSFQIAKSELPKFNSCQALADKLKESYKIQEKSGMLFGEMREMAAPKAANLATDSIGNSGSADYSATNIQVAGVDEADIVKTDGEYIYTVSKNNITISRAYPAEKAKLLSRIKINGNLREIFIEGDNLLAFGARNIMSPLKNAEKPSGKKIAPEIYPNSSYRDLTFVEIYNLSNRQNPVLKRKLEFEGNYYSSRKIDNYVYFVLNSYPDYQIMRGLESEALPSKLGGEAEKTLPRYRDSSKKFFSKSSSGFNPLCGCSEISYLDPVVSSQYLTVIGLPIDDYNKEITKEVVLGGGENIYASPENLYVAKTDYSYSQGSGWFGLMPNPKNDNSGKTTIYKFSLDKDKINYLGEGEVKGRALNQFSMDEYDGHFRIATTVSGYSNNKDISINNIYILDGNLKTTGKLEKIAPGESIYAARFMGKRAYLVTFRHIDPLFAIDLSNPSNPKILGKLKIPGYSDYLHPYDETHIIGIGKEVDASIDADKIHTENAVYYTAIQGVKLAMFDVSDVENPVEMYKEVIGDKGTESLAAKDHKAFLFDKNKKLLVIPITFAERIEGQPKSAQGAYTFQGSYVYNLDLDKGFVLKGRVTHHNDNEIFKKSGYYFGDNNLNIKRNLYIGDNLYSISDKKILINSLDDLSRKGEIGL